MFAFQPRPPPVELRRPTDGVNGLCGNGTQSRNWCGPGCAFTQPADSAKCPSLRAVTFALAIALFRLRWPRPTSFIRSLSHSLRRGLIAPDRREERSSHSRTKRCDRAILFFDDFFDCERDSGSRRRVAFEYVYLFFEFPAEALHK